MANVSGEGTGRTGWATLDRIIRQGFSKLWWEKRHPSAQWRGEQREYSSKLKYPEVTRRVVCLTDRKSVMIVE